jgi:hypothetical protein
MAFWWDKKLIIRIDEYFEKDGENGVEKQLTREEFIEKYKENLQKNCIAKENCVKTKEIKGEYFPIETEIVWTDRELRRLLKEKLIRNGKEVKMYNDGMKRNVVILDGDGKFLNMKQLWYGSKKGKRKVDMLIEMSREGIVNLRIYERNEYWFKL